MILTNAADSTAAMKLFEDQWQQILSTMETGDYNELERQLTRSAARLKGIALKRPVSEVPVVTLAGEIFEGAVKRIAPYVLEVEKQARTVDVEVDFICQQDCENMLPGYSADIEVILDEQDNVLRIPTEAILEGNKVLVFTADNLLQQREIKTGLSNWEWTQVVEGLSEGEEVVVSVEREGVEDGVAAQRDTTGRR